MARVPRVYLGRHHAQELQAGVLLADVHDRGQHHLDALNAVRLQLDRGQHAIGCVERGHQGNAKAGCRVDQAHVEPLAGQRLEVGFQVLLGLVQRQKNGIG